MKKFLASLFVGGLVLAGAGAKTLVVYYSYSDTANTKRIAEQVQQKLGVNISDYDTIVIGTPTWWYKMASPVLTFLSGNSFAGKNVALFSTHAGWAGTTIRDMEKLCSGANILATAEIQFGTRAKAGSLVSPQSAIDSFIEKIRSSK